MPNIKIGEQIRRRRILVGWSQSELAAKVGVSQMTVSNWESGKSQVRPEQKKAIYGLLGVGASQDCTSREDDLEEGVELGASAVGSWLTKSRLERGMSIPELSAASGVTAAQLYNIESGRTTNPRESTIQRIEKALGEALPPETKAEILDEATVEGVGEFVQFDPYQREDWPDVAGIYVLYDISDRPIYVGQGASIKRRIRDHEEKFWYKQPIVSTATYLEVPEGKLREKIEKVLIRFLGKNAVINKQNVER
ncbi:helix-turn-helix domain-containing protein [Piscinibacter sakaiensis]|uniref:helix-turn-helix domain-containing protein n=1 Tax=Piscinibacter sakaiensis TaxID=1547922 RepID=UPI0009EC9FDF|nr:helix-turn-helix domain-containing protein [Piscinibacter sakaiensis]